MAMTATRRTAARLDLTADGMARGFIKAAFSLS
jgi:hypothetical protein